VVVHFRRSVCVVRACGKLPVGLLTLSSALSLINEVNLPPPTLQRRLPSSIRKEVESSYKRGSARQTVYKLKKDQTRVAPSRCVHSKYALYLLFWGA